MKAPSAGFLRCAVVATGVGPAEADWPVTTRFIRAQVDPQLLKDETY